MRVKKKRRKRLILALLGTHRVPSSELLNSAFPSYPGQAHLCSEMQAVMKMADLTKFRLTVRMFLDLMILGEFKSNS